MNIKKTVFITIILLLLIPTLIFSVWFKKKQETYKLNVGMVVTQNDPMFKGAEEFKKNVEKRTNGNVIIEIFPSSQLGDTKDMQEQVRMGSNVAVITDAARLAEVVPEIGILAAPFVVDNFDEARKLVISSLFKGWTDQLAEKENLRVLSFNWYQGARHLLTNKPIKAPADLNGLRIRTIGATVFTESIKAMGATPTPLAWAEVYPGIQQKVIDGAEAQHPAVVGARLYEVIKYITKTGHFQLITGLVCSESWFKKLPKNYQSILLEEALKAGDYASKMTIDGLGGNEAEMKKAGVTISEVDKTPFIKNCEVVYEKLGFKELKTKVDKIVK